MAAALIGLASRAMTFTYPAARRSDTVDDYHGTAVHDPYRWLEDPGSEETKAFVRAQNEITLSLSGFAPGASCPPHANGGVVGCSPYRSPNRPRRSGRLGPQRRSTGSACLLVRRPGREDRALLDPNTLSEDGATAVVETALSDDGQFLAYSVAESGSDWQTVRVRDTETSVDLAEELHQVKFAGISWHNGGFLLLQVSRSRIAPRWLLRETWRCTSISWATTRKRMRWYSPIPTTRILATARPSPTTATFWFSPNGKAPRTRTGCSTDPSMTRARIGSGWHLTGWSLVRLPRFSRRRLLGPHGSRGSQWQDRANPPSTNQTPLRKSSVRGHQAIELATAVAGRLLTVRLHEASHLLEIFDLDGTREGSIDLPGIGTVAELTGRLQDESIYIGFQSFLHPPTALQWSGGVLEVFAGAAPPLDPDGVIVERQNGRFVRRHRGRHVCDPSRRDRSARSGRALRVWRVQHQPAPRCSIRGVWRSSKPAGWWR